MRAVVTLDAGIIDPHRPADNGVACVRAWNDRDRNGLRAKGEPGVAGLLVVVFPLDKQAPRKALTAPSIATKRAAAPRKLPVTDKAGRYCFTDLPAGKYQAVIALGPLKYDAKGNPVGIERVWTLTAPNVGNDELIDSDFKLITDGKLGPELKGKAGLTDAFRVKDDKTTTVDAGVFKDEPKPTPSPTKPPAPGTGGGSLPVTGVAAGGILAAGALLLGGGVAMTVLARRRRRTAA
jgi:hypothetical protein